MHTIGDCVKLKLLSSVIIRTMPDLYPSSFIIINQNYRRALITKKYFSPYFNIKRKIHSIAYSSEVHIGLQHHIFIKILLRKIQQSPIFPSEVNMHIIIGHCILNHGIHVYNKKHDTDSIVNIYFFYKIVI